MCRLLAGKVDVCDEVAIVSQRAYVQQYHEEHKNKDEYLAEEEHRMVCDGAECCVWVALFEEV